MTAAAIALTVTMFTVGPAVAEGPPAYPRTRRPPSPTVDVEGRQAIPRRWLAVADCESDRRWHIDALHDGGVQFTPTTWRAFKPDGYPDLAWQASPWQQIRVAERVLEVQGAGAWPNCGGPLR